MNDMLEKKIGEHADAVFAAAPPAGHRERFAAKLAARRERGRRAVLRRICGYAAVAAAFVAAVFLANRFAGREDGGGEEPFDDVRNYYVMLLEEEVESTRPLLQRVDSRSREELVRDIESICAEHAAFRDGGERNEALLVNVYSSKIEAVQHIRSILSGKAAERDHHQSLTVINK
jgi:hypothetical protein